MILRKNVFIRLFLPFMDGRKLHVVDLSLSFRFDDVVHLEDPKTKHLNILKEYFHIMINGL